MNPLEKSLYLNKSDLICEQDFIWVLKLETKWYKWDKEMTHPCIKCVLNHVFSNWCDPPFSSNNSSYMFLVRVCQPSTSVWDILAHFFLQNSFNLIMWVVFLLQFHSIKVRTHSAFAKHYIHSASTTLKQLSYLLAEFACTNVCLCMLFWSRQQSRNPIHLLSC